MGPLEALIQPPANPATPYNQGVRNILHSLLVEPVQQAGKALAGRMTDNEAQNFALEAAAGLIPIGRGLKAAKAAGNLTGMARRKNQDVWLHGTNADFDVFDLSKAGSGSTQLLGANVAAQYPKAAYLTTSSGHASQHGPEILKFEASGKYHRIDAKAELNRWARENGYPNAQKMLDGYYKGDLYDAFDFDRRITDALREAKAAGKDGAILDFGDLTDKWGRSGKVLATDNVGSLRRLRGDPPSSAGQTESSLGGLGKTGAPSILAGFMAAPAVTASQGPLEQLMSPQQ